MRIVDDRIDNLPSESLRNMELRERELSVVASWERVVTSSCIGTYPTNTMIASCNFAEAEAVCESFIDSYQVFPVPTRLHTNFFEAMRSEIMAPERFPS